MVDLTPMPYKEAIEFFKKRLAMSQGEFAKLAALRGNAAKTAAFTVADMAWMDVLNDVWKSIEKAVTEGETFWDFRKRIDEIMVARGWKGMAPHRLDNIFRTNVQMSYMAGRHDQMKRIVNRRPYWQYSAVNDSRTRPTHAAMDGKVFLHDDPFWDTWYPPNGYRCRCSVTSLSEEELREEGLEVEEDDPKEAPDEGWDFNPGKEGQKKWQPDMEKYPEELRESFHK